MNTIEAIRAELEHVHDDAEGIFKASVIRHLITTLDKHQREAECLRPRTVTTTEELEALPVLSVIRVGKFETYEKQGDGEGGWPWVCVGESAFYTSAEIASAGYPATILYTPEADQ